ncbi:MAG TPA: YncE family protein, partial [Acidimicrobiia bacterium]|nr:YncE family protein [Acidimicrobiia bacterium]
AGTLALVANRSEGTVSIFTISGKRVTPAGKIDLGDPNCGPSLPVFTPDGKRALVTRNNDHRVSILAVNGTTVEYTKRDISANLRPYGMEISPKGDVAVVANIGNGPTGGVDTISLIDLTLEPPRLVDAVSVGIVPEGIALSPDGTFLAVNVMNGSNVPRASSYYHDFGVLKIMRLNGTKLTPLTEANVPGHWCEGAAWSRDQRTILVQCMVERVLFVFGFDGRTLKAAGSIKVNGGAAGIRTADR